jgi:glycosyltransferase involved in cell wall biosynthesis
MRRKISAVVHTRNEAHNIIDCLASLDFADERVVIDNDSTDATPALAAQAGARVARFPGDFGYPEPARAFGLTQLQYDWVLILDADERVTPELRTELLALRDQPAPCAGYWIPIRNFHFGRWLRHGGLYPDYHLRFFLREKGHYPELGLHRGVAVNGAEAKLTAPIDHYSYRDLAHYFQKFNIYTSVEASRIIAQQRIPTGYDLLLKPWHRWLKHYFFKGGFLDGFPGYLFHLFSALYVMQSEAKAWEHYAREGRARPIWRTLFQRSRGKP